VTDAAPLTGVRVLDLSVMISGPLAGMILADQGADVIKVESPGLGDLMRLLGSSKGGVTGIYLNNNRGKRSLVLDLKQPAGADVLKRLVADADVLIQNFRPGAMARLGLDYETLAALNPDLIYVSISGYGPDGPSSHRRVYDNVIQAASGFAAVQTDPASSKPTMFRMLVCDKITAYTAAQAITSALFARATGKARGQCCWTKTRIACRPSARTMPPPSWRMATSRQAPSATRNSAASAQRSDIPRWARTRASPPPPIACAMSGKCSRCSASTRR
jgi:crotonobetainyl-CoA:carnitine CoA-transferase CaiB-like acyl-CoA transferase